MRLYVNIDIDTQEVHDLVINDLDVLFYAFLSQCIKSKNAKICFRNPSEISYLSPYQIHWRNSRESFLALMNSFFIRLGFPKNDTSFVFLIILFQHKLANYWSNREKSKRKEGTDRQLSGGCSWWDKLLNYCFLPKKTIHRPMIKPINDTFKLVPAQTLRTKYFNAFFVLTEIIANN